MRGVDRVVIRDGDAISALLTRLGAHDSVLAWEERRMRREVRATANRLANFDDANLRRSARAAVAAGARVKRALEILGDEAPEHLIAAGQLRIEHAQASLEELGQLADPPMTKDAVAGRIRRLLAMADQRASDLGLPGTEAGLTPDMLVPVGRRRSAGAVVPPAPGALARSIRRDARPGRQGWSRAPRRRRLRPDAVGEPSRGRRLPDRSRNEEHDVVTIRVGINGFGRIGRNFCRAARPAGPTATSRSSRSTT